MDTLISYQLAEGIATIILDDGKANVMSERMIEEIGHALDRAELDGAVVLLTGRTGVFSAGFDLGTMRAGGESALRMLNSGFALAARLAELPLPVIIACHGHALAMGAFLVLAADLRIGVSGDYKLGANEVAIGLPVPYCAIELCRMRLTPASFQRGVMQAEIFNPVDAVQVGFLDRIVDAHTLDDTARAAARHLAQLDRRAYLETKKRLRHSVLQALPSALEQDDASFRQILGLA
ncbi:MAG: crotonase/enoyl-CoA hydratase family protein [Pseudomonadales bacterium]|nr:crotonase/enoyl-CoA hydratase family protein [Pseudomonadales bacterium]